VPTLIPLRALARRSGRFPPLPYPPPRFLKCTTQDGKMGENKSTLVAVLIRRFGERIPAAFRQLEVSPRPGRKARRVPDYGAATSPAGRSNRFYRCRALCRPSADVHHCPRASTKGRVEARSRVEKNDRRDLAEKIATQQQVEDVRTRQPRSKQRSTTEIKNHPPMRTTWNVRA